MYSRFIGFRINSYISEHKTAEKTNYGLKFVENHGNTGLHACGL